MALYNAALWSLKDWLSKLNQSSKLAMVASLWFLQERHVVSNKSNNTNENIKGIWIVQTSFCDGWLPFDTQELSNGYWCRNLSAQPDDDDLHNNEFKNYNQYGDSKKIIPQIMDKIAKGWI